jgi:hypothetical protein
MRRAAIASLALFALTAAPAAAQQPLEYRVTVQGENVKGSANDHFMTFDAPFQIPDVSLPAGTYVFTIVAPSVIRVSSPDRSHHYGMFFTTPVNRAETGGEYLMEFVPTVEGAPARIARWFLPNQSTGFEIPYPKAELAGER